MNSSPSDKPEIARITRRQFLLWTGGLAGTAAVVGVTAALLRSQSRGHSSPTSQSVRLPEYPSPNPAYRALPTTDGGMILWTNTGVGKFLGYRFNAVGRSVWRLCDGTHSLGQIASEYQARTGRVETEAREFIAKLSELGVAVTGAFVVTAGSFPKAPKGASYHQRISASDPSIGA
ncbi:MAG TPA: PqqD family protein [Verrucomicrobiae bacterium]|nr:PqqD family protein [Verrucomicrobiae bacterium]